jgi:hypothetical protein
LWIAQRIGKLYFDLTRAADVCDREFGGEQTDLFGSVVVDLNFLLEFGDLDIFVYLDTHCFRLDCCVIRYVVNYGEYGIVFRWRVHFCLDYEVKHVIRLVIGVIAQILCDEHVDFHPEITIAATVRIIPLNEKFQRITLCYIVLECRIVGKSRL